MNRLLPLLFVIAVTLPGCALKELFVYEPPHFLSGDYSVTGDQQDELVVLAIWLDYAKGAHTISADRRKKEQTRLEQSGRPLDKGKLAILMSLSQSPTTLEKAKKLASAQLKLAKKEDKEILANFLQMLVTQIESQRDAVVAAKQNQFLNTELQHQEEQAKLLTKQINALKSIEKSIYEREYGFTDSGE